ncbi:hypothetical protein BDW60DRAFT_158379 [Aspergillus nidulans var. acristatus]
MVIVQAAWAMLVEYSRVEEWYSVAVHSAVCGGSSNGRCRVSVRGHPPEGPVRTITPDVFLGILTALMQKPWIIFFRLIGYWHTRIQASCRKFVRTKSALVYSCPAVVTSLLDHGEGAATLFQENNPTDAWEVRQFEGFVMPFKLVEQNRNFREMSRVHRLSGCLVELALDPDGCDVDCFHSRPPRKAENFTSSWTALGLIQLSNSYLA